MTEAADVLDVHSDKKWVISCLSLSQLELQPSRPSVVSVCLRLLKLASPQSLWHHMTNQQRHVLKQILGVWDLLYYTPLTTSSSGHHKLFILTASDPVYVFFQLALGIEDEGMSHNVGHVCVCLIWLASIKMHLLWCQPKRIWKHFLFHLEVNYL